MLSFDYFFQMNCVEKKQMKKENKQIKKEREKRKGENRGKKKDQYKE